MAELSGQVDTAIDLEEVSSLSFGLTTNAVAGITGEIFEGVGSGYGASLSLGAEFDERYAFQLALGGAVHEDDFAEARASTVDLTLEAVWRRDAGGVDLGTGAIAHSSRRANNPFRRRSWLPSSRSCGS